MTDKATESPEATPGGAPLDGGVRPVAWLAGCRRWTHAEWTAHRGEAPPGWADFADPLYALTPADVAAVNKARQETA